MGPPKMEARDLDLQQDRIRLGRMIKLRTWMKRGGVRRERYESVARGTRCLRE